MTVMLLEQTPAARIMGVLTTGPSVKNHISPKMARELIAIYQTMYHSLSLVYRRVPLQLPHLLLHLHHRILYLVSADTPKVQYPKEVEKRERSYGETRCTNQQKAKIKIKNERREEVQSDLLHELPGWLQEFRENLVDERSPFEPRGNPEPGYRDTSSSSHEVPMEPRAQVEPGSGKRGVYTHCPKDPNCDICLKTKITRSSCRRRAGTVVPRTEDFGDMTTADHKNSHRYAVTVLPMSKLKLPR